MSKITRSLLLLSGLICISQVSCLLPGKASALHPNHQDLECHQREAVVLACAVAAQAAKQGSWNPRAEAKEWLKKLGGKLSIQARYVLDALKHLMKKDKFDGDEEAFCDLGEAVINGGDNGGKAPSIKDDPWAVVKALSHTNAQLPTLTVTYGPLSLLTDKFEGIKSKVSKMCTARALFDLAWNTVTVFVLLYAAQQALVWLGDDVLGDGFAQILAQSYFKEFGVFSAVAGLGMTWWGAPLKRAFKKL